MAGKKDLVELLQRRKAEQESPPADAADRKKDWLKDLNRLMGRIDGWLSALKKRGLLDYEASTVTINEAILGEYDVPALRIVTPGGRTVKITPVGTYVINALGRVDILSGGQREMLARFGPGDWCIMRLKPDGKSWDSRRLDDDTFYRLLTDLLA